MQIANVRMGGRVFNHGPVRVHVVHFVRNEVVVLRLQQSEMKQGLNIIYAGFETCPPPPKDAGSTKCAKGSNVHLESSCCGILIYNE